MDPERQRRRRERVLKTVAVLPSLATLGNLVCGLGAVYLCLLSVRAGGADLRIDRHFFPTYLSIAAYLLMAAMVFDGLDGRLARFARKTSEFGGQLDSLADVVSFGLAPAVLVLCIVVPTDIAALSGWERVLWRAQWVMAAIFVCCAALRLAKFNVENVADESAHMGFSGLPTPGAAAAIMGMVILHQDLLVYGDVAPLAVANAVKWALPVFAMVLGLLMVSRCPYAHMVNALLRRSRPFHQVVLIVIVGLVALVVQFQPTIAVAAAAYAMSGPVLYVVRKARGQAVGGDELVDTSAPDWTDQPETFSEFAEADEVDSEDDTHRSAV